MKSLSNRFDTEDLKEFEPEAKVGLIATVNPAGLPHLTLITALQAKDPATLVWGQFSEGLSKEHVKNNPRTGFLIMTPSRSLWRGKALWTGAKRTGEDYDMFNEKPMFRYNAYFGIHTVHYMDLVETAGRERLPLAAIAVSSLLTLAATGGANAGSRARVLKPWAEGLFNRLTSLKFLAALDRDGFPRIVPLFQCRAADSTRLIFSPHAYTDELRNLEPGMHTAVFGLTMDMEDVLVRGIFRGFEKRRGIELGIVDIDWVYNSMPPVPGQIYPEIPLEPVTRF
ncbi:MAG: pyridoxamine 5'-phosphate oxidase family protein [Desulfomonilia bacterium]|jgi:hypothetical protein